MWLGGGDVVGKREGVGKELGFYYPAIPAAWCI